MSTIDTLNVVSEAVTQALEKMAFLTAIPFEETPPAPEVVIMSQIEFSGPQNGRIRVAAGLDFATTLALNISGGEQLSEQECADAMKELANVTCGLVLPMIANSPADVFDLTVPHLTRHEDRIEWDDFINQDTVTVLNVEEWPLAISLRINENEG